MGGGGGEGAYNKEWPKSHKVIASALGFYVPKTVHWIDVTFSQFKKKKRIAITLSFQLESSFVSDSKKNMKNLLYSFSSTIKTSSVN